LWAANSGRQFWPPTRFRAGRSGWKAGCGHDCPPRSGVELAEGESREVTVPLTRAAEWKAAVDRYAKQDAARSCMKESLAKAQSRQETQRNSKFVLGDSLRLGVFAREMQLVIRQLAYEFMIPAPPIRHNPRQFRVKRFRIQQYAFD
jgi:hypothetical protein